MEAARETGVLTLVSEMSGLEGKRAAGSQALEPWARGWEQAGVRSSASLRLLNPSGGGEQALEAGVGGVAQTGMEVSQAPEFLLRWC